MKIKTKKIIAAATALLCLATTTTGCKKNTTSKTIDIDNMEAITENTMPITTEDVTLSVWRKNQSQGYAAHYDEYEIKKIIEEKTGIKLKFTHPSGAALEQFNIMLASGDLPDIMIQYFINNTSVIRANSDGTFLNIAKYVDKFAPNFKKIVNSNDEFKRQYSMLAGKDGKSLYYMPGVVDDTRYRAFNGYFLRKDWLDKLGLSVPETIADWEKVLAAFRDENLGQDGKTIPFATITSGGMNNEIFASGFGLHNVSTYFVDDKTGKVSHTMLEPQYKEYLKTMNRWYKEGLLDPNILAGDVNLVDSMMLNNQLGSLYIDNNNDIPKYLMADKNLELVAAPYPKPENGETFYPIAKELFMTTGMVFSAKTKYPVEAIRLADFLYSEEGSNLLNWGIENETYIKNEDGTMQFTDVILKNPQGKSPTEAFAEKYYARAGNMGLIQNASAEAVLSTYPDRIRNVVTSSIEYSQAADSSRAIGALPYTYDEILEKNSIGTSLDSYMREMHQKFILGKEPIENIDAFVEKLHDLGIDRILEIMQAAYDRSK